MTPWGDLSMPAPLSFTFRFDFQVSPRPVEGTGAAAAERFEEGQEEDGEEEGGQQPAGGRPGPLQGLWPFKTHQVKADKVPPELTTDPTTVMLRHIPNRQELFNSWSAEVEVHVGTAG